MNIILPMRPTFAGVLKTEDDLRAVLALPNVIIQPKLGGDRVVLHKEASGLKAFNRKGQPYMFSFGDPEWLMLMIPDGTILDGEVYKGEFHPFDCLRIGDLGICKRSATDRIATARELADSIGHGYKFSTPSFDQLREMMRENQGRGQKMKWEGVVVKDAQSPYVPLKNYRHESYTWRKYKWL